MKNLSTESSLKGTSHLYSTNHKSIINQLLALAKECSIDSNNIPPVTYSRYGFVLALENAFISDENKRLERILPEVDFNLSQNGGFSFSCWVLLKQSSIGVHRYIFKKGNTIDDLTPSLGILPNGKNLFMKFKTSKHKIESLYSSKELEVNRMYNIVGSVKIDYVNGLTDISLFIDGLLDSQVIF